MPKTLGDLLQNKSTGFDASKRFYKQNPVKEYTLQDLRDDEEFNDVSERFLKSLGEGENADDLFNYFRGADFNLGDAFSVYSQSKNFTDQQKQDYLYLRNKFDNANIGGLWERVKVGGDIAQEIISDPATILSALFIPFTGGASGAARLAAGKAVQAGLKKLANKEIAEGFAKGVAKIPGQKLKAPLSKKQTATILGAEGFLYGGTDSFVKQSTEVETGQRASVDLGDVTTQAALTGLGAAGLYGAGVGLTKVPAFRKSLQDRRMDRIDNNENYKADIIDKGSEFLDKTTDIISRPLAFLQKPTSKFINRMKDSETLEQLIKTFRYDADKRFISKELGTQERLGYSYSEELDDLIGEFQIRLTDILNPLKTKGKVEKPAIGSRDAFFKIPFTQRGKTKMTKLSFGKKFRLDPEVNDDLFYFLNTEKTFKTVNGKRVDLSKEVLQAGNKIRRLLDDIQTKASKEGAGIGRLEKYFPRKWMAFELQEELNNPGVLTKEIMEKEGLSELEVQDLLSDMIQNRNFAKASIMDLGINTTRKPGLARARTLKNIDDTKLEKYLDTDVESVISDYLHQASGLIARKKYFGINVQEFQERFLNKIDNELGPKKRLTVEERENLINIYKVTTGQIDPIQNKYLRGLADGYTVLNQMALLPLATITSLSEIGVPLLRGAGKKAFEKGKGEAELGKGGVRILWDTAKEFTREFHNSLVKKDVDVRSGSMKELNRFNRAMGQAAEDRALAMFGEGYGVRTTAAQNKFFKYNLLHQWTRFVQLTSYEVGKSKIYENLLTLANKQAKGAKQLRLQDELNELGIDIDAGIKWINDGANPYGNFYKNNFTKSAARYVDEVIMNPKAAANQKPLWHSYAGTRWAFGLLGFPVAFSNTVLKNAVREVTRDARAMRHRELPTGTASIMAGLMTMTTAAMIGDTIRSGGRNLKEVEEGKKDLSDLVQSATKRAGLWGPLEYAYRIEQNRRYQTLPESVVKNLTGPAVADIIDLASGEYGRGALSLAVKKIPGVTILSSTNPEAYKDLLKWARDNDVTGPTYKKDIDEEIQPKQRPLFATGGLVEGPDVPFTKENPADRVDPFTGEPYQEQMSRLGFKKGGYVIQKGDTLWSLSKKFGVSIDELLNANKNIDDRNVIFAGQELNVPTQKKQEDKKVNNIPAEDYKKLQNIKKQYQERGQEGSGNIPKQVSKPKPVSKKEADLVKFAQESGMNVDTELIEDVKRGRTTERLVPLFVRQFIYDTFGGDDDITSEDFNEAEYNVLKDATRASLKAGKKTIDYDTFRQVGASPGDVRTRKDFSFTNPADSVQLTLGNAGINVNENGDVYIKDQYNWNDAEGNRYKGEMFDENGLMPLGESTSAINFLYRFARNFKTLTGRGEGKGSKVNVYLGNIKDFN